MSNADIHHSRRRFIIGATALVVGTWLPVKSSRAAQNLANGATPSLAGGNSRLHANAFVQIDTDGTVTVLSKHTEVGQGIYTAMATLVAEELDADWSKVHVEAAPADTAVYKNLKMGIQGTGGSSSVANAYMQMRQMGAVARYLLITAAAKQWHVPSGELVVKEGIISHELSGRSGGFGEFVLTAATLPSPDISKLVLKKTEDFRLIGKVNGPHRVDSVQKTTGKAYFPQDIHEQGMLTVTLIKSPLFGGKLKSFSADEALRMPGVKDVRATDSGVAIYAKDSWTAIEARKKVKAEWDNSSAETRSSEEIFAEMRKAAENPGVIAARNGNPLEAVAQGNSDKIIEAEYLFPYLAHAPMEPLTGYLLWDGDSVYAKYGCQIQTIDQIQLSKIFNIPVEKVTIETVLAGGSFGRRIDLGNEFLGPDLAADMAAVAKAIGPGQGIKLISTREDDIRGGWYRPMILHKFRAAIRDNKIIAWMNTISGHSFAANSVFAAMIKDGVDRTMVEGSKEPPYSFEHFQCDAHIIPGKVPTSSLRSVGSTHSGHAVESFIDQLLEMTGQDPVTGRLALMEKAPREAAVLKAVAAAANWKGSDAGNGRMRGVGVAKAFGTSVAQIAEVSIGEAGIPKVHKIWCAVDCGVAVNPDVIKAQIEGGIGYGLGIALYANVSLNKGFVEQSNFNNYRPLRINEMPEVEVIIVPSSEAPSGVGELGVPTIAPAVGNALAKLGRSRSTLSLPFHRLGTPDKA
ncbi:xanthine dehydrogenase family protein molybdopterin-binding subunit [Pantoea rwandensis]|uniref:Aldehyde oxidase n=1 Tax=Pantoea rwandensis TaxID=1076550 RepID=A0A1X1D5C6_9GAMM|nr:molybdopterin cofactor-binding domain-containing protein [Pantoea rwandensis]ORM71780.1 aldehyde oxidase [Pantoea rwandensis]